MRNRSQLRKRSVHSIVQQTNMLSTKDVLRDIAAGKPIDINPGNVNRSYDCDDQAKVDLDDPNFDPNNPTFVGFRNLMDQSLRSKELYDHIHPEPPKDLTPPPAPPQDPPTPE